MDDRELDMRLKYIEQRVTSLTKGVDKLLNDLIDKKESNSKPKHKVSLKGEDED